MTACVVVNNHNCIAICRNLASIYGSRLLILTNETMVSRLAPFHKDHQIYIVSGTSVFIQNVDCNAETASDQVTKSIPDNPNVLKKLPINLNRSLSIQILRATRIAVRLAIITSKIKSILKQSNVTHVFAYSDRTHDYVEAATLKASKKLGIKVSLPYAAQFNIEIAHRFRLKDEPHLQVSELSWASKILFKRLINRTQYDGVLWQDLHILLAHHFFGTLSTHPWCVGNGITSNVFVDSQRTRRHYMVAGCPEHKIRIVGHSDIREIFLSFRNRKKIRKTFFKSTLITSPEKKIVVLSMPQYWEQGYLNRSEHLEVIQKHLEAIPQSLAHLVISFHPRQNQQDYQLILEKFDHSVLSCNLAEFVGAADMLLASNSTVLPWGVYCQIETIGTWTPNKFLYQDLDGVEFIPDFSQLKTALIEKLDPKKPTQKLISDNDRQILSYDLVFNDRLEQRFHQEIQ